MGPVSKEAVCAALGHIIDEQLQQRHTLNEIRRLLERQLETDSEGMILVNRRVTEIARRLDIAGIPNATPAE